MVCNGCRKPTKQVLIKSPSAINKTGKEIKRALSDLKLQLLNEVCKDINSNKSYLHFSTIESASVFYNIYARKGVVVDNIQFTVHPTQLSDGSFVTYSHQKINFSKRTQPGGTTAITTTSQAGADAINTTTIPTSQAGADAINTTTIPTSQAGADAINTTTIPTSPAGADAINTTTIPTSQAGADATKTTTVPTLQADADTINTTAIPTSPAGADATNTTSIPTSQAGADATNTTTTTTSQAGVDTTTASISTTSEWVLTTKCAINEINEEIRQLKEKRGYLEEALKEALN